MTAPVTVALGNVSLRGGGRLLTGFAGSEPRSSATRPVGIGSGIGSVEGGRDAQSIGERNSSGAPGPSPAPTPRRTLSPGILLWGHNVLFVGYLF